MSDENLLARARHEVERKADYIDFVSTDFAARGFGLPDELLRGAVEAFMRDPTYRPHPKGEIATREAIAHYYAEEGRSVDVGRLLVTASTSEAYALLFGVLCRPGEAVLLPRPSYPLFEHLARTRHVETRFYDLAPDRGFAIDLTSLRASLRPDVRAIVVISPNNPTGAVVDDEQADSVCRIAAEAGVSIIHDEVFSDFLAPGLSHVSLAPSLETAQMVFTLNGASKLLSLPGLKIAWIAVEGGAGSEPARIVDSLETDNDALLSAGVFAQRALSYLLPISRGFRDDRRRRVHEARDRLVSALSDVGLRVFPPRGGVHAMIELPHGKRRGEPHGDEMVDDEEAAVRLLRDFHIHLHPGYLYDHHLPPALVCSYLAPPALIEDAARRLAAALGR